MTELQIFLGWVIPIIPMFWVVLWIESEKGQVDGFWIAAVALWPFALIFLAAGVVGYLVFFAPVELLRKWLR